MKVLLVVLTVIVGVPRTLRAAETTIIVLHQQSLAAQELRLTETLRIYTRDLSCRVVAGGQAPAALDAMALERIAAEARAKGADAVLWAQRRSDGAAVFYLFNVPTRDVRETEMTALGSEPAAVEVALKVRALLTGRVAGRRFERPAGQDSPPGPPPLAPSVAAEVSLRPASSPPYIAPRFALGTGFDLVVPRDTIWLRTGLIVGAAVRLGSAASRIWLFLDGAFTSQAQARVRGFVVTLKDVPLGAGVQASWSSSRRVSVAIGSRTSLHVFDVGASASDGRTGVSRRYAVGLGGVARTELSLVSHLKIALAVSVEALAPTQEFTIAGQQALSTGSVLFGATAGVVVSIP